MTTTFAPSRGTRYIKYTHTHISC